MKSIDWANAGFTPESARRYYEVSVDPEAPGFGYGKFKWVNMTEVLPPPAEQYGRHQIGFAMKGRIGLIPLNGVPRFELAPKVRTQIDFYFMGSSWIISDRSRRMFEEIDGPAFEFEEAHVTHGKDGVMALGPYWRMDVYRVLDCIDEENSIINGTPSLDDPPILYYINLLDIKMKPDVVGSSHAFRDRQGRGPIFDSAIVDEIRNRGYRGMKFTPLQMPTFAETKRADIGDNSWHWRKTGPVKEYWEARNAESDRRYQEKLARGEK